MSIHLKDFIEAEGLAPGSRLPPERDLVGKLGLPRTAIRRMLAELEAEGRVIRHVGRGTFIADGSLGPAIIKAASGKTAAPSAVHTYPAEVFEIRLIVEPKIAALAAHRATPQETAEMQRMLRKGRHATSLAEFERYDAAFHKLMVGAARNQLVSMVYEAINNVRGGDLWGRMKEQSLTPQRMRGYADQHESILRAIIDRDSEAAERRMREHIVESRFNTLGQ